MDVGIGFLTPILLLFREWMMITIDFFGATIPLWAFIVFAMLVGLFIRALSLLGGIHWPN